jgi:hypothetical protein
MADDVLELSLIEMRVLGTCAAKEKYVEYA